MILPSISVTAFVASSGDETEPIRLAHVVVHDLCTRDGAKLAELLVQPSIIHLILQVLHIEVDPLALAIALSFLCLKSGKCVCVCVCVRERERERVCVCVSE